MSNCSHLDQLLKGFISRGLPGCALKITKQDQVLYEGYFGQADMDTVTPIVPGSVFRLASMSKIPLYVTLMMLYERGLFLLTDPVYCFLPEWKHTTKFITQPNGYVRIVPTENPLTIRDVLSMKCGLPYCHFSSPTADPTLNAMQKHMQPLWEKGSYTLQEQVAAMAQVPMSFEPGTHWLYGFSSEIAAALVEAVTGKAIDDVFEELLFEPLGMKDTRSRYFGDIEQRMVRLYNKTPDGRLESGTNLLDIKHLPGKEHETGWARLFSTVNDFSVLMQMLANRGLHNGRRIMGRKTIDLMRTNGLEPIQQKDFDGVYNAGYGYGYGVRTLIDQQAGNHPGSPGAFGWTGGFGTWCEADPSEGVSIVYMHNQMPNEEEYHHLRVRNAAYGLIV